MLKFSAEETSQPFWWLREQLLLTEIDREYGYMVNQNVLDVVLSSLPVTKPSKIPERLDVVRNRYLKSRQHLIPYQDVSTLVDVRDMIERMIEHYERVFGDGKEGSPEI